MASGGVRGSSRLTSRVGEKAKGQTALVGPAAAVEEVLPWRPLIPRKHPACQCRGDVHFSAQPGPIRVRPK